MGGGLALALLLGLGSAYVQVACSH